LKLSKADGVEIKQGPKGNKWSETAPADGIPFHPYYTVKDILGVTVFLIGFFAIVFFAPEMGGYFLEKPNFEPANALKTPEHIAPVWYFTPFYTVLRAIPDPWWGTVAMFTAIIVLFFLPWIDKNPVKSWRYRNLAHKFNLLIFAVVFIILGWMGVEAVTPVYKELGTRMTQIYFLFFGVLAIHSKPFSTEMRASSVFFVIGLSVAVGLTVLLTMFGSGFFKGIFLGLLVAGLFIGGRMLAENLYGETAKGRYVMWFIILLGLVIIYDLLFRLNLEAAGEAGQLILQLPLVIIYLGVTLLLPAFKPEYNAEKPVPERVTG